MVHPGKNNYNNKNIDEIHEFRQTEYEFLKSSEFKKILEEKRIKIKDFNSLLKN